MLWLEVVSRNRAIACKRFVVDRHGLRTGSDGFLDDRANQVAYPRHGIEGASEYDDGDQRQFPGIVEKNADERERRKDTGDEKPQVAQQAGTGDVGIIVEAVHDVAGVARIEKRGFKRQQLVVQCRLEVLSDVCTDPDIQISDQIGHTTLQYGKTDNEQWREPWR